MFWTITFILVVLWGLGLASGARTGLWIHLWLLFALVSLLLAVASSARVPRR